MRVKRLNGTPEWRRESIELKSIDRSRWPHVNKAPLVFHSESESSHNLSHLFYVHSSSKWRTRHSWDWLTCAFFFRTFSRRFTIFLNSTRFVCFFFWNFASWRNRDSTCVVFHSFRHLSKFNLIQVTESHCFHRTRMPTCECGSSHRTDKRALEIVVINFQCHDFNAAPAYWRSLAQLHRWHSLLAVHQFNYLPNSI